MMHWLYTEFTKISSTLIFLTQLIVHYEDIIDRFAGWLKLGHLIERRKSDMFKYLELIPLLEKLATDLEAAAKSPEDQVVAADLRALIADIGSTQAPTVEPPVSPPPTA